MRNGKYVIAIMSAGSGVGESVVVSCNLSSLPIYTIGFDVNAFAYGSYDCDYMDSIPVITSDKYLSELVEKCQKHQVDLIIPGLDDEALLLAKHRKTFDELNIKVVVSDYDLIKLVRDKELMCKQLTAYADVFVDSYSVDEAINLLQNERLDFPLISKPRDGSASAGVEIILEMADLLNVNKKNIVQNLAVPHMNDPLRETYLEGISKKINRQIAEISIQVVNDSEGNELGRMMSYNMLKNGVPIEIVPCDKAVIWAEIDKLLPKLKELGHKGPLNIQGRMTDQGLQLFEMNARFTGITGLRAMMGFNEVESCIINWLGLNPTNAALRLNTDRCGIRQVGNKVISINNHSKVKAFSEKVNGMQLKPKETIFITGSSGYLSQAIINQLDHSKYDIIAISRDVDEIEKLYNDKEHVLCYSNKDIERGILQFGQCDVLIHCAFARPFQPDIELIQSLEFSNKIFNLCAKFQVPKVINISSQSVYGTKQEIPWSELTQVSPDSLYGQAKYSSEIMASTIREFSNSSRVTSIRLGGLAGGASGLKETDFMSRIVKKVLNGEKIQVFGDNQITQRLDIRDAAQGIVELVKVPSDLWPAVLNFGASESFKIIEAIECITNMGEEITGKISTIEKLEASDQRNFMLDSSKFFELVNWKPQKKLPDIVRSLFDYFS